MKKYTIEDELDSSTVVAEVFMLRATGRKSVLILEGVTDYKIFVHFIDQKSCEIVISHGKDNLIESSKILNLKGFEGFLSIVDKDFDDILKNNNDIENVIKTDFHDIELMMFFSEAFERIITEKGSKEKITSLNLGTNDIKGIVLDSSYDLGVLRLFSHENDLNLRFKELKLTSSLSNHMRMDPRKLFTEVCNHSQKNNIKVDDYLIKIKYCRDNFTTYDYKTICCGHDVCQILGIALQKYIGTNHHHEVKKEIIESLFRASYTFSCFSKTILYRLVRDWENTNAPYVILR